MPEPVPTRREDPARHAAAGPLPTRREDAAGPARTRREAAGPAPAWSVLAPGALPAALAARLTDLTPMPMTGGEAHLLRVRDAAFPDAERVLKVYFPQIEPDPDVWTQLASIRTPHVVTVVETGTLADGRFFELMEYLPHGSLRDAGAGRRLFDTAAVTATVRQLADGLAALHGRGITHRDLKPENVLVRSTSPELELVLTDFGLSRRLDASAHFTTGARTSAYAAPEAWSGHVSPARDWWSLGIMVLELATGTQPFRGLDERVIQMAVTTKPVPVELVADPRVRLLCAGLLVSDEKKRWNGSQVRDWLAGRSPAVPDRRVAVDVKAFEFDGQPYVDPESLAVAMAGNWRLAARRYGISPSPSWSALTTWLHQFDEPGRYPPGFVERRLELLGELENSAGTPDVKLVRLLAELNPRQPPIYRQAHVDVAMLRRWARLAQDADRRKPETVEARETVDELWAAGLLEVLARFDGEEAADLARIGERWSSAVAELDAALAELRHDPRLAKAVSQPDHRPAALASMLELAAGAPRGGDWVRDLHARARSLPAPVGWFDQIVTWAGTDPARACAALHAAGVAHAEADAAVRARQAAEQARLVREHAWADHERQRLDGRGSATGRAIGGAGVLAGLWFVVALLTGASPQVVGVLVLVVIVHAGVEIALAQALGADYHPRYALLQSIQERAGGVGSRMRMAPGRWALALIGLLVLFGFVHWLAPVAALAGAVGHVAWTGVRHQRWSKAQEQYRQWVLTQ